MNQQANTAIAVLDEMIQELDFDFDSEKELLEQAKSRISALWDGWIDVNEKHPEENNWNRILAYDEWTRNDVITATLYRWEWLRDDNEKICFFDLWQPLPLPPITK